MLAILAIIAVISGLILVSDSAFGGQVLLENLAYDMALSIRQAQVYGISVQRNSLNTYNAGYGVHFDTSNPTQYVMFADICSKPANALYDPPDSQCLTGEAIETTSIDRGFYIAKICAPAGSDSATCHGVNSVDIEFVRPEPDAIISGNGASCAQNGNNCSPSARIVVKSPRGNLDSIIVYNNGQVSVSKQ